VDFVREFDEKMIQLHANMLADGLAQDIAEKKKMVEQGRRMSCRTRGNCRPLIEAPDHVQDLWAAEIALNSAKAVHIMDQVNIFLNGGNVSGSSVVRLDSSDRELLEVLMTISEFVKEVEMYVYKIIPENQLHMIRDIEIEPFFAMYETQAICFYDGASKSNSTFVKKFTEMVSKEKYSTYIKELSKALQNLIKSEQLEKAFHLVYERIVDGFKQFDVNAGTGRFYRFLLEFRAYLLSIDLQEFIGHINEIYREADEGIWKLSHGEWPEMAKCLDNMIRITFGSKPFYERLNSLYQSYLDEYEVIFQDRQKELSIQLENYVIPFFRELLDQMNNVANGDSEALVSSAKNMEHYVINAFKILGMELSRELGGEFWCDWQMYFESYMDMKVLITNNDLFIFIRDLLTSNWPQGEVFPKSLDEFLERLYESIQSLVKSLTCYPQPYHRIG